MRGCEVEGMLDQNGKVIEEGPDPKPQLTGDARTYRLYLDTNQYKIDMDNVNEGKEVRSRSWVLARANRNLQTRDEFSRMCTKRSTCW